jgi:hypothetical protein
MQDTVSPIIRGEILEAIFGERATGWGSREIRLLIRSTEFGKEKSEPLAGQFNTGNRKRDAGS